MTAETRIKTRDLADDTGLRSLEISIGRSKIVTPSKSLGADIVSSKQLFSQSGTQFNEIFSSFNPEKITNFLLDSKKNTEKNRKLKQCMDNGNGSPAVCFIDYNGKQDGQPLIPTLSEIETLTNIAYTFSSITPIPAIPKVATAVKLDNEDLFIQYIQNCIDSIEVWNHKPIMGYLPIGMIQPVLEKLIDIYLDHGINAYYLDYNLSNLSGSSTNITALKKKLAKRGYSENHCFYVLNMKYGKVQKENPVLPARDFLGFGLELDIVGNSHRGQPLPSDYARKITPSPKKFRVLNRDEYGYYRVDLANIANETHYPTDSPIPLSSILSTRSQAEKERLVQQVNLHEQTAECVTLQQIVSEKVDHTYDYFQSKSCLSDKDLKILTKGREFHK